VSDAVKAWRQHVHQEAASLPCTDPAPRSDSPCTSGNLLERTANLIDGSGETAEEASQAASRRRLDDLFQSMLHRAFNGEL
jgi:hypothetical protein